MGIFRALGRTGAVLALAAAFATARAQEGATPATDPASPPPGYAAPPESSSFVQVRHDPLHEEGVRLGRAALEQALGNEHGVIAQLEHLDFSREPRFADADRAAFLLGQAYLRAGSMDRFGRLARSVAKWRAQSVYTQWIAFQQKLAETRGTSAPPPGSPPVDFVGPLPPDTTTVVQAIGMDAADVLAAGLLLRQGNHTAALDLLAGIEAKGELGALVTHLRVVASGEEDSASLARLAESDTSTALGRDLAGAALVRTAVQFIARNADPAPILERVSPRSRYFGRARHVQGLYAIERGSGAGGQRILESLYAEDSSYVARREVGLALAGQALSRGDWNEALRLYQEVDRDWAGQREALGRILSEGRLDPLWDSWEAGGPLSDVLTLDGAPAEILANRLAAASADLGSRPSSEGPALGAPEASAPLRWPIAPPPPATLREVARSGARLGDAAYERDATHREVEHERVSLADLKRYLGLGLRHVAAEQDTLRARVARMDSIVALLDQIDGRLRGARDEAKRRIAARATRVRTIAERQLAWVRAMRLFYMEGPYLPWPVVAPPGFPTPDSLTRVEESLARAIHGFAQATERETPDLIDRSYQHAWRPGLIDRAQTNRAEVWRLLSWAQRIDPAIQLTLRNSSTSPRLEELLAREALLGRTADSLRLAHGVLRERVARDAIAQALETIQGEREGIDYGLAASAYAISVGLSTSDSAMASAAPDTAADDPESARMRREAIANLEGFLAKHPESAARGEMRFRLADLLLVDERQVFRAKMAHYLAEQSAGRNPGAPPVLTYAPAYRLYRAILEEDRDYPHRDAVLFNTGMILADEGNPEAERWFQELVTTAPESRYAQESYARMGDQHFNDKDFAGCIPFYERAAQGQDPTLRAISLYKLGWARFNGEQFFEAANAFQAVMDVYDSTRGQRIDVDIAGEAEQYLVHSLARAGGAGAFATHFGEPGRRPYERRVLRGLGAHFRRYSLFAEAAETEQLYLERYPHDAEALVSAERLAETYQRWNRPELARQAQLDNAARFAPQSEWADAQESDSLREAGERFSKASWTAVAKHHHLQAREKGDDDDWREAQRLYQQVLVWWPQDSEAPLYELYSGEASAHLNDYEGARAHYARAAAGGADSVASEAMWQRVAVTDAWYEKSRGAKAGSAGLGTDTLARAVIQSADDLTARYPSHPHAADAIWRTGHLALAHGWYDRAASDFGALATRHAGDKRAPAAGVLQADALFQVGRFEDAGKAYESALVAARGARADSLARKAEAAIPVCAYRLAEASVAADSSAHARHAELFEQVASRWPKYEHAHLAQYRAGLAYARAGNASKSVAAMQKLIDGFPKSEYVKDAHLQVAKTWETANQSAKAGDAYARFAERYPSDSSAAGATLKGADLLASGGQDARADTLRLAYVRKYPGDVETAMEVYEALARRDLKQVSRERPVSSLLAPGRPAPVKNARGKLVPGKPTPNPSYLAEYMRRAEKHPKLASQPFIAEVRFQQGEEAYASYDSVKLAQPLAATIPARQKRLDSLMVAYRRAADVGVAEWSRASAYRIGQALVGFGTALEQSERPADLQGEDLQGYDDVLKQQAQAFYDRGEDVWSDLLRKGREAQSDPWIARAQKDLWGRVGTRFYFRPEVDYPVVSVAQPPEPVKPASKEDRKRAKASQGDPIRQAREQMALSPSPYWPYRLGHAHVAAGATDSAEADLRRSIARDSSYAPALSLLSKLYFETGRHQQAIDLLEAARARSKDLDSELLVGLALHHDAIQQGGQAGGAMASGAKPDKIKGGPGAYLALRGPKPEEATSLAEAAVMDGANSAPNQNNFAITRLRAGDPNGARQALEKAIELNPKLPGPYYNLAILEKYFVLDDDAAAKRFRQYWALSHDDPDRLAQAFDSHGPKNVAEKKD